MYTFQTFQSLFHWYILISQYDNGCKKCWKSKCKKNEIWPVVHKLLIYENLLQGFIELTHMSKYPLPLRCLQMKFLYRVKHQHFTDTLFHDLPKFLLAKPYLSNSVQWRHMSSCDAVSNCLYRTCGTHFHCCVYPCDQSWILVGVRKYCAYHWIHSKIFNFTNYGGVQWFKSWKLWFKSWKLGYLYINEISYQYFGQW